MLFNSFSFFVFFIITTIGYYKLPHTYRWIWLLLTSCYFYMAAVPVYILVLFAVIGIDYVAGLAIEKATTAGRKKVFLLLSLGTNLGILGLFKYYNFCVEIFEKVTGIPPFLPHLWWVLPIGLSFHTFQAMSYTIEVYRGNVKAERHLGIYALYVLFYPQLVAGPIERPQRLLSQFRSPVVYNEARVLDGMLMMLWGLFKKMVIADRLAPVVEAGFGHTTVAPTEVLIVAAFAFTLQIYIDFSAYSEIARGAARTLGIELMQNFDRPLVASTVTGFWQRWHISLSQWFRDYVYIPLGGSRHGTIRNLLNILVVFLISGLWHGANWTFILWGALMGLFVLTERALRLPERLQTMPPVVRYLGTLYTITAVTFAFIFFRANSITDAWIMIRRMLGTYHVTVTRSFWDHLHVFQVVDHVYSYVCWLVLLVLVTESFSTITRETIFNHNKYVKQFFYGSIIIIWSFFYVSKNGQFIYFQF